ncbi:MAG TPA: TRAP transporter small permease [Alphaproteobacteria bacterium]
MERLVRWMALLAGATLVGLTLLTAVDVTLRAAFNAPIYGIQEVTELGLVLVTVLGIAYCAWTRAHIVIDVALGLQPRWLIKACDAVLPLVGAALMAVAAWRSFEEGAEALARAAHTNVLRIPQWPFFMLIALGLAAYAVVLLIQAVRPSRLPSGDGHPE